MSYSYLEMLAFLCFHTPTDLLSSTEAEMFEYTVYVNLFY